MNAPSDGGGALQALGRPVLKFLGSRTSRRENNLQFSSAGRTRAFGVIGVLDRQRRQQKPLQALRRRVFFADMHNRHGRLALCRQLDFEATQRDRGMSAHDN